MSTSGYARLVTDVSELDEKEVSYRRHSRTLVITFQVVLIALGTLLIVSLGLNVLLLRQQFHQPWKLYNDLPSQYADLRRDLPREIVAPEDYSSLNRTIQDTAWDKPNMVSWELFVALDEDYVVSQGLPHAQRWPWDPSKGVYILTAAHELHCVHVLRSYVNDMEDGIARDKMDWHYPHAIHCLNVLRESVMCHADDTPMYTGRLHENVHAQKVEAGRGMIRMCRNWDTLVAWAHSHSACYLSVNRSDPNFAEIDRYKYCPDNSRPWESRPAL